MAIGDTMISTERKKESNYPIMFRYVFEEGFGEGGRFARRSEVESGEDVLNEGGIAGGLKVEERHRHPYGLHDGDGAS